MARQSFKLLKDAKGRNHLVLKDRAEAWLKKHGPKQTKPSKRATHLPQFPERGSWVWDGEKLVERHLYRGRTKEARLQVIKDIEPFLNVAIDGKPITGRRQKRDMMRAHGLTEVGNEYGGLRKDAPETYAQRRDRAEDIKHAFRQHGVDIL